MRSYQLSDTITNISCGVTSQVIGVFLKVLLVGLYAVVYEKFRLATIPTVWWSYLLIFIGFDFCYYWMHRLSHQINLFWAGHSVHHQSEEYNFSVALRQSSTQIIWTFFFYLPLALIGFDPIAFVTVAGVSLLYQFWIHTELINRMPKWFEFCFNCPSHHRVHHAKNAQYIDKNHAGILILWDRIFGTFREENEKPMYGTTKPLNSWNPVWANLANYTVIIKDMKGMKNWKQRFYLLFSKPGQLSKNDPDVSGEIGQRNTERLDGAKHSRLTTYVVIHFIFLLLITAVYFLNHNDLSTLVRLQFSGFIVLSVISFGFLLENRKGAIYLEFFRILILSIISIYRGDILNTQLEFGFSYLSTILAVVSLIVLVVALIVKILSEVYEY